MRITGIDFKQYDLPFFERYDIHADILNNQDRSVFGPTLSACKNVNDVAMLVKHTIEL